MKNARLACHSQMESNFFSFQITVAHSGEKFDSQEQKVNVISLHNLFSRPGQFMAPFFFLLSQWNLM